MAEAQILVERTGDGDPLRFRVTVTEGDSRTVHEVTLSAADLERLGGPFGSPEELVEASFRFLLAREPKEAILPSFDLPAIARYFPGFEGEVART
ncbi:MAG TPA: hypothetical protein VNO17_01065 [Actinomycetota bacterium]|nr:hypothetical protein [Actinomycetota bacterium]